MKNDLIEVETLTKIEKELFEGMIKKQSWVMLSYVVPALGDTVGLNHRDIESKYTEGMTKKQYVKIFCGCLWDRIEEIIEPEEKNNAIRFIKNMYEINSVQPVPRK